MATQDSEYTRGYVDALDAVLDYLTSEDAPLDEDTVRDVVRAIVRLLWPRSVPVPGTYKL